MTIFHTIALLLAVVLIISLYFTITPVIITYFGPHFTKVQKRNLGLVLKIPAFLLLAYALWFYTQHS